MSFPEPATDGFFCRNCQEYRTRSAVGLCPTCDDERLKAERAAATRRPAP